MRAFPRSKVDHVLDVKVLITGASGKTGALVVKELLSRPDDFDVKVTVRSEKVCLHRV